MKTTRQAILECIKKLGEASVAELSQTLNLTQVTIRHHLDSLRDDGFLDQAGQRRKTSPGRPEIAYHLTLPAYQSLPRSYESLLLPLLESIQEGEPTDNLESLLVLSGQCSGQAYWAEMQVEQGEALEVCIQDLAQYLERNGYLPKVQQTQSEVKISLHNCPFFEARVQHTQVCAFDIALLSTWISPHGRLKINRTDPHRGCRFVVQIGKTD